jgi:hypothetical protein
LLLGKLLGDFLPVKVNIRMQPPHITFVLHVNRVVVDFHDVDSVLRVLSRHRDDPIRNAMG